MGEESIEVAGSIPQGLYYSFYIGGALSVATILWPVLKTPEIAPSEKELAEINHDKAQPVATRIVMPFLEISKL
ncbi:MAG: maltose/moltooligosaccharide transporter [Maribacter sp.]